MTLRSLWHLFREWTWTHKRKLDLGEHDAFQQEYLAQFGHYRQAHRSRDFEPFPGHDTRVDVWEAPLDRTTKTTQKGYTVRRWVRGKELK